MSTGQNELEVQRWLILLAKKKGERETWHYFKLVVCKSLGGVIFGLYVPSKGVNPTFILSSATGDADPGGTFECRER